jgi:hypothetical protein
MIEILKAMAQKFVFDREDLFVIGYSSRPVLHVKINNQKQRSMWLSFSDALLRYGLGLKENDWGEAYIKAGVAFIGQLKQIIVVLHNKFDIPTNVNRSQKACKLDAGSPRKCLRLEAEGDPVSKTPRKRVDL